ncbi:hypothetical protein [Chitinophaga rhizosphaerae]|uniref:hypothetical protein n=1 Tax=Chitinophaga rhizosphaerae TaxID=1864947 RepID=UPI000F80BC0A|nr:hypothetical protein [Chitinophaga rhizosphaerae]
MHNPLAILRPAVLEGLLAAGHRWFVRQQYPRGMHPSLKAAFLISAYRNIGEARAHFEAIADDPQRRVYDGNDAADRERLFAAAAQPDGYAIYVGLLAKRKWSPDPATGAAIKQYVRAHTNWKPDRKENLHVSLFIQFGELFLTLKTKQEEIKIPFSDIEKT